MIWTKLLPLVTMILGNLSPEIRKELAEGIARLEAKAAVTKNPFDDIAIKLLRIALGL